MLNASTAVATHLGAHHLYWAFATAGGVLGAVLFLWAAHVRFDEWRRAIASVKAIPDAILDSGSRLKTVFARHKDRTIAEDEAVPPRRRRRVEPSVTDRREPILRDAQPSRPPVAPPTGSAAAPGLVVSQPRKTTTSRREMESRQGSLLPPDPHEGWTFPPLDLLAPPDPAERNTLGRRMRWKPTPACWKTCWPTLASRGRS